MINIFFSFMGRTVSPALAYIIRGKGAEVPGLAVLPSFFRRLAAQGADLDRARASTEIRSGTANTGYRRAPSSGR